jgi:glucose-6-phosphate 1-dehydrogenase
VLVDAIRSEKSLFTSSAEVVRSWELLAPIQQAWGMDDTPLVQYKKGASVDEVASK